MIGERRRSEKMKETTVSTLFFESLGRTTSPIVTTYKQFDFFERGREKEEQQHALTPLEVKDNS